MLNYSHAREHVFLTNIQDCEHSRVINSLTVPIPYKQLFNLALKVGNRLIDLTFMFPLSDIKQSRFFIFAQVGFEFSQYVSDLYGCFTQE